MHHKPSQYQQPMLHISTLNAERNLAESMSVKHGVIVQYKHEVPNNRACTAAEDNKRPIR